MSNPLDKIEIVPGYPPNYDIIVAAIPEVAESTTATFAYAAKIYNPHGREVTNDLRVHEAVHHRQQGDNPDAWWSRYLTDPAFRLSQEIEAYGEQFAFVKDAIEKAAEQADKEGKVLSAGKNNLIRYALEGMSRALSSASYGNIISRGEAESKIRNYGKAT